MTVYQDVVSPGGARTIFAQGFLGVGRLLFESWLKPLATVTTVQLPTCPAVATAGCGLSALVQLRNKGIHSHRHVVLAGGLQAVGDALQRRLRSLPSKEVRCDVDLIC